MAIPLRLRTFEDAQRLNRAVDAVLPAAAAGVVWALGGAPPASAIALAAMATLLWKGGARLLRHYDANGGRSFRGDLALTMVLLAATLVPTWVATSLPWPPATAAQARSFAIILAPSLLAVRLALVGPFLWRARQAEQVLVVGIGPLGRVTGNEIRAGGRRQVVGYLRFADETPHERLHAPLLGTVDALEQTLRARVVDEVFVASMVPERAACVQKVVGLCETLGVPFALPLVTCRLTRAQPIGASSMADGYVHYLTVQRKPVQRVLKRAIDIVASGGALVALAPLLLATAAAVRLTSRGPVLFRQARVGLHGRVFSMLKFRSMIADAESLKAALAARNERTGPVFKMKHDPRVTPVGRFIRKYSIDELPQLVNVLRGDMSLVGPRPPLPSEVARYDAWQRRRLSVRPGLTCVWQVSGRDRIGFAEWMLLDLRYIDHWSLARDMSLIARTVPVVLTGRGAS